MNDQVFFATRQPDDSYLLHPSDGTDPDERDFLSDNVKDPGKSSVQAQVHVLGTVKTLDVYRDDAIPTWGWVRITDAFPNQ